MSSWHSYTSLFNVSHAAARALFDGPVLIEEKVDGSQFSFGIFDGEIRCRSKGQQINLDAPEGMFVKAIESVRSRAHLLQDGWTYRGEYLQKRKHNSLTYDRHPEGHVIIFDISPEEECYLPYDEKVAEAQRIGLEAVPRYFEGVLPSDRAAFLESLLEQKSVLGDAPIEGVVIKNYAQFGPDKKVLIGKFVSKAFRELHGKEWKAANPGSGDIVQQIIKAHTTEARWQKAVQHLSESGQIEGSPRDIGPLCKEVAVDVRKECESEIKDFLFKWAWPQISRGVIRGLPDWYKNKLEQEALAEVA